MDVELVDYDDDDDNDDYSGVCMVSYNWPPANRRGM